MAGVVGVVGVLLLVVATVAVWARATVSDSERVAELVGDALADAEVEAALAAQLTDLVFAAVDVEAAVAALVPDQLQQLTPLLGAGARSAVDRAFTGVLGDPRVQALITQLVERSHDAAMGLLRGDGLIDGVSVDGAAVTINLLPLLGRGVEALQGFGLLTRLDLPELTADGDPRQQVAALEAATGRDLPDDFGQLVVYESDRIASARASLEQAQGAVVLARRALWLALALAAVAVVACIVVATDRWRAVLVLGLGVLAAMVLTRAAVDRVVDDAPQLATEPGGQAAIDIVLSGATTGLQRLAAAVLLVAAIAVVAALAVRRWPRGDLVLVAAVVLGSIILGVLGLGLWSLLVAVVVGALVLIVGSRLPAAP